MSPTPEARERRRHDRLIILCAACALLCFLGTVVVGFTTLSNNSDLADQKAGRSAALDVTCGTNKAIIEAGRTIILGGTERPPTPEMETALRRLGFPPYAVRREQAEVSAAAYALRIAQTIQEQSGKKGIVNRDGSLNCDRLKAVANAE